MYFKLKGACLDLHLHPQPTFVSNMETLVQKLSHHIWKALCVKGNEQNMGDIGGKKPLLVYATFCKH